MNINVHYMKVKELQMNTIVVIGILMEVRHHLFLNLTMEK